MERERSTGNEGLVAGTTSASHRIREDDQLVRDCREFDALERIGQSISSSGGSVAEDLACSREIRRIIARQVPILRRIVAARAHTQRGLHDLPP